MAGTLACGARSGGFDSPYPPFVNLELTYYIITGGYYGKFKRERVVLACWLS